jgi:hypothetical protein
MALRERLIGNNNGAPATVADGTGQHSFQEMKSRLHRTLINRMDLTKLQTLTPEQVHAEVSRLAESVLLIQPGYLPMRPNGDPMFRGSQVNSRINGRQAMATENFFDGAAFG